MESPRPPRGRESLHCKVSEALAAWDREAIGDSPGLIGVDEVGRGAFAGPLVAGAVHVSREMLFCPSFARLCQGINDSKKLAERQRESLFKSLEEWAGQHPAASFAIATGVASVQEVDRLNVVGATRLAMARALESLRLPLERVAPREGTEDLFSLSAGPSAPRATLLIDGPSLKAFPYRHRGVVRGDATSLLIAAASILAKVTRDREMRRLAPLFPAYGWEHNKGYGSRLHLDALVNLGPTVHHRRVFVHNLSVSRQLPVEWDF